MRPLAWPAHPGSAPLGLKKGVKRDGSAARAPCSGHCRVGVEVRTVSQGMDRFVSTYTNKIDAKGRVSIPASFRNVLELDGYKGGIYCYPSLDAEALDAGGERLAHKIDGLLQGLPDYSDERDELSVALYGDVHVLSIDGDGRIILPQSLRDHAKLSSQVTFVGLGEKFQMWRPETFKDRHRQAREKAKQHRMLFGAGSGSRAANRDGGERE